MTNNRFFLGVHIILLLLLSCGEDSTTDLPDPTLNDQTFSVLENPSNGTFVGSMVIENSNGKEWEFSIVSGNINESFRIENIFEQNLGRITVAKPEKIDFETVSMYELVIEAQNGETILIASARIEVRDRLELPPTLPDKQFKIAENSSNDSFIGTIEIENGERITWNYEITDGNVFRAVSIDATSGNLTVADSSLFDYESIREFNIEVSALSSEMNLTSNVTIQLIDEYEFDLAPDSEKCKLERASTSTVALGFPKFDGLAPSVGAVNMTILFVDFNDVPATKTTQEVFDILNPISIDFFDDISYGNMQLVLEPHLEWLRLSEISSFYGNSLRDFFLHRDFIQEAVNLADNAVDFQNTDIVLVISNPDATAIPYGPTFTSPTKEDAIQADGNSIRTGITSGLDLNYWGGLWLPHETGHSLTLPDLYQYGSNSPHIHVGDFSLMGDIAAGAPGYFAFERWNLGWLNDNQIYCHESGDIVMEIQQLETEGGIKALVVPLSTKEALVLESRRGVGFDSEIAKEGVLPYVINTTIASGQGTIVVKPGSYSGNRKINAPMSVNDEYTYRNVQIKVLKRMATSDKVQVIIN